MGCLALVGFASIPCRLGNPARMTIQPKPGARSSWAIRCVAIHRPNPAVGPLPAVGPVVAGTCRGDAASPVLSALPCAAPPVPSALPCAASSVLPTLPCAVLPCAGRFVAAVNPFIIETTGWRAVFAAGRALKPWRILRPCRLVLHIQRGDAGANEPITCFRKPLQKLDRLSFSR